MVTFGSGFFSFFFVDNFFVDEDSDFLNTDFFLVVVEACFFFFRFVVAIVFSEIDYWVIR